MRYLISLLLALLLPGIAAAGDVRWVSDQITIMLRAGQGNSYQILRMLPSGARLDLLEVVGDYARVRTEKGTEGWVLTRLLTDQPIAADRLVQAEAKLEKLAEQNRTLNDQLNALKAEKADLAKELKTREDDNGNLSKELTQLRQLAASPMRLKNENDAMRSRLAELESALNEVTATNNGLRDTSRREWFVTGAGVLGGGIVLGLVLPLLKRRKRDRLYDY